MSKDSELKKVVLDELSWEPSVDAAHIGVTAKDGVITLTGHVDNYSSKAGAEKAASRVKGVKAVVEEIEVKLPYDVKRSDEDIAAAAVDRLGWNSTNPNGAVQVKVEKGWVTLSGTVDWQFEKEAAPSNAVVNDRRCCGKRLPATRAHWAELARRLWRGLTPERYSIWPELSARARRQRRQDRRSRSKQ